MKKFVLFIAFLCMLNVLSLAEEQVSQDTRETVLDRKIFIEDKFLDVPKVSRLCDEMDIWKRHVHIGDCSLYCEQEGEGMPVVLLHGGPGGTHHLFHPYFSRAKDFMKVVYYDQRGCGLSQYVEGDGYNINQAADDLDKLRKALGIEKWVVLGYSYGGTLAQVYAVRYPENIAGLVFVGSAFHGLPIDVEGTRQYDYLSKEEKNRMNEIRSEVSKAGNVTLEQYLFNVHLNGDWKRQNFYKPSREQLARMALYEWKQDGNFRDDISSSLEELEFEGVFDKCPLPVLIMEGKWDLTWAEDKAEKFQKCFSGSKLVMFERSGHSPFEDEPEKFFSELKKFVQDLEGIPKEQIDSWERDLVIVEEQNEKARVEIQDDSVRDAVVSEVIFRTEKVAPSDFDYWTFFWVAPERDPDANLEFVVFEPDGKEYYRNTSTSNMGEEYRSDFCKEYAGGDPKVFYNKHVVVKLMVDKGSMNFPDNAEFRFEFKKKN